MNTVLGVILLVMHGQIVGANAVGAYPSSAACQAGLSEKIQAKLQESGAPPPGVNIAKMCVDLTEELKQKPPSVST